MKAVFLVCAITLLFSCSEQEESPDWEEGLGTLWLSGGLYFCADQIRMAEGDTLIVVNKTEIAPFKSGDEILVKYRKTGQNESGCTIGTDCEILEIKLAD